MDGTRKIGLGDIQREAGEAISSHTSDVWTYLAIFIPLTTLANWADIQFGFAEVAAPGASAVARWNNQNGLIGFLVLLASVVGQYTLFERMTDASRDGAGRAGRILGFFGLGIVSFLGVGISMIFLIVPGLFVGSRWLMSPAFYIDERMGVFEALGASWQRTRGNTGAVMLALFLLGLASFVVGAIIGGILGGIFGIVGFMTWGGYIIGGIASEIWTVLLIALAVGVYRLLGTRTTDLAETFA